MAVDNYLIITIFRDLELSRQLQLSQWELLLRQARASNTLGNLAVKLKATTYFEEFPAAIRWHLESAIIAAEAVVRSVRWEIYQIMCALRDIDSPVVFLKGAAYVIARSAAAKGRLFHDIDFMLPKHRIDDAEKLLMLRGWHHTQLSTYDNRYYRRWMHEIPPLKHLQRKSILDVHHAILPETARLHPDTDLLIKDSLVIRDYFHDFDLLILSPVDQVLHSATHLFHDGELEHGFRDLLDMDTMLREYGLEDGFWKNLLPRARCLELGLPLYYALRYCERVLRSPIPQEVLEQSQAALASPIWRYIMDGLFLRALVPAHHSCNTAFTGLARWLLYVRSHYLRMPLQLLVPHLVRKALSSG